MIKMDDIVIEPLSEAFGQNLETVNINTTGKPYERIDLTRTLNEETDKKSSSVANLQQQLSETINTQTGYTLRSAKLDEQPTHSKTLSIINKLNGLEAIDDMETIVAKDVEQGKCAFFKRVEIVNEKRSVNEPKYTPVSKSWLTSIR